MLYFAGILTFIFAWVFMSAVLMKIFGREKPIDKIKFFDRDDKNAGNDENPKNDKTGLIKFLSSLVPDAVANSKGAKRLEADLIKADIPIPVREVLTIKMILSLIAAIFSHYAAGSTIFAILSSLFVYYSPRIIISYKKKERLKLFDEQLNEGIIILSSSLKAGYSFLQSLSIVVEETKEPLSKEFRKLLKEISLGIAEEDALKNLLFRVESEDLKLMVNVVLIQKDVGGNLSGILDNISEMIRDRQKIKNELKTLTAQGRLSGVVVMLIPVFLCAVFFVLNKSYMLLLFTTPVGLAMVVTGIVSELFGFLMIRKIVNIEM